MERKCNDRNCKVIREQKKKKLENARHIQKNTLGLLKYSYASTDISSIQERHIKLSIYNVICIKLS